MVVMSVIAVHFFVQNLFWSVGMFYFFRQLDVFTYIHISIIKYAHHLAYLIGSHLQKNGPHIFGPFLPEQISKKISGTGAACEKIRSRSRLEKKSGVRAYTFITDSHYMYMIIGLNLSKCSPYFKEF